MGDEQQHQGNGYQQYQSGGNYQGNPQQNYQQQNYQQQNYQQGYHNQGGNGNNWDGQHQQQQQMYNRNYQQPYPSNQQQGRGGGGGGQGNYGYMNQQQETNDYYGYEGAEDFDQDDYENLEAIERAISGSRIQSPPGDQYGEYADEEDRAMAELEEEMHRARGVTGASGRNSTGSYLPVGAVPRQNGVLSVHAKEFWFPECRNCTCCKGFKHGCDCCAGGVDTCAKEDCINTEFATQVATELASRSTEQSSSTVAQTAAPAASKPAAAPAPRSTGGSYLPAGAVPRQNGVLSAHAKEFWFPECRNCTCCKGFKHGCDCCAGGVDTCAKEDCINTEFATQVATDLANRTPEVPADGSSAAIASGAAAAASIAAELGNMNVRAPASAHTGSSGGATPSDICKFYASGGCRFGDSCRFKHVGTPPAAPTSGSSSAKQICPFFLNSQCQYGDSCRKSHDISGVAPGSYLPPGAGYH